MNINIAFNTIIYIMVFLFPGFLFRRGFFTGAFNKQFESGNAFERTLWYLLISIGLIAGISILIILYDSNAEKPYDCGLKFTECVEALKNIYENKLPEIFKTPIGLVNSAKALSYLYLFSFLSGIIFNKIIFYLGLEKRFPIFQFQNNWHYLTTSNRKNNRSHGLGDIFYTKVDVKVKSGELFTGELHYISYDKDAKIEAITIQEAYRFKSYDRIIDAVKIEDMENRITNLEDVFLHSQSATRCVFQSRIKGHLFTISNTDVENIAITYINVSNIFQKFKNTIRIIASLLLILILAFFLFYAVWDFGFIKFDKPLKRIIFCISAPLSASSVALLIKAILNIKFYKENSSLYFNAIKDSFLFLIILAFPLVYVFFNFPGYLTTVLFIILNFVASLFITKKKNEIH